MNSFNERSRVRVPKAAELIANELRRQIVRGELTEGENLAPEAELMERFGVSRPTLREASRILESQRLISVVRGARGGAKVHLPDLEVGANYTALLLQVRGTTLADVYEARKLIEPPAARAFAGRRLAADVGQLRDCLEAEERAIDTEPDAVPYHFARFHQLLVDGAGNTTMSVLAGMLRSVFEKHLDAEMGSKFSRKERLADNRRAAKAHERLVELIEAGDGVEAEKFWLKHMNRAGELLLKDLGATTVVDLLD